MTKPLTKDQVAEVRYMYGPDNSPKVIQLCDSHESLRDALTQSAEKLAAAEAKMAAIPDLMGPLTPKEYSIAMRAIRERAEKAERERDEALEYRNAPLRKQFAYAVWMAEDFVDEFAARTLDGRFRVTMTLGEPDERGVFTPIMYRHDDPLPEVARLERTVERMREALTWALPYAEHWATDGHPDRDEFNKARAALAASSPDHAGAPEGEGHERPPAEQQSRQATLPPSVEAGEGDK